MPATGTPPHHLVLDPQRWEAQEAGTTALLERWLACEGDRVDAGQPVAVVRVLHEALEVCAPHEGVIEQILVAAGESFGPGQALARMVDF